MLATAIKIASEFFEHTHDKGGSPYIMHCLRVMFDVEGDDELMCIAVLHDVIEDIFKKDHEKGFQLLRDYGFSERVISALDCLTHRDGELYDDYIRRLSFNEDAVKVKLSDLKDNSNITRLKGLRKKDFERMEKYHRAFTYLKN